MTTLGYLFILLAGLVLRGLTKGRSITQLPTDVGDAFTAAIQGNVKGVTDVLARTGDTQTPTVAAADAVSSAPALAALTAPQTNGSAARIVAYARAQIGKPYLYGGTGPNAYDCSGLAQAACADAGITIPRTTFAQIAVGTAVAQAALQPGDLVFPDISHVQIYSGNGNIIEAAKPGTNVREVPMWGFMTARRVVSNAPLVSGG